MRRILLGFALALAIGGCTRSAVPSSPRDFLGDLEASIRAEIGDPARREVLLARVSELSAALDRFEAALGAAQREMGEIGVRQDATLEELRRPLDAMGAAREEFVQDVVRIRLSMRSEMSRREWDAVTGNGLLERLGFG